MSNLEYLSRCLAPLGLSPEQVELVLFKAHLAPHTSIEIDRCDRAMYEHFSLLLAPASQKVSEGSYSQSWNMEAIKAFYTALCHELGEKNVLFPSHAPTLRNKSYLW